ncbi:branched-chain amino acid ABC transporter permease [Yoonia sp. 2307UL14-13]|uniref:branched-chain amino acid ABC transporter permease n=1 Tax=Yoonia sp. 2307UL14-13 TaxID=3126506 RepID=UPI00309A928D
MSLGARSVALHLGLIAILIVLGLMLPTYHQGNLSRILVLATYAVGYNVLFGYTGLLSLGHAMFFAAGMYGCGMIMHLAGWSVIPAFVLGLVVAAMLSIVVGLLALRTIGVAFMIVTLMFAQTVYLTSLYFGAWTGGDEGFVISQASRQIAGYPLTEPTTRFFVALTLFGTALLLTAWMMQRRFGRVLIGVRENEERTTMLGYDVFQHKLAAVVISGVISGAAGAAYAVLFGYVGSTFATVQYSILPLLWVLLGGMGTTIGPLIGVAFMFYLIDYASGITSAYMLVAGATLVLLTLFARAGIVGEIRKRWVPWLP